MRRATLESLALLVLFGLCLFVSAGRTDWPMAWAVLALFAAFGVASFWLVDADLIRERAAPGPGVKRADALVATLGFVVLYPGLLVVAGLDAVRFGWSPTLPLALRIPALGVFVLGYVFAFWAMRSNPFFATFVRIQSDRGHRVVTQGPYARLRHPGYAGMLVAHLALPLALGSLWGLGVWLLGALLFVARTALEDRTLTRELPGYREYRTHVPWRLVPHVW